MNKIEAIKQTKCWLLNVIIAHNICPFAKREFDRESIRYSVSESIDLQQNLELLIEEARFLDENKATETSLLIIPHGFESFDDYLDFLAMANQLLIDQGYEGIYQLASFHPDYCFEGEPEYDAANYTNRSPCPMLHLIRETSLEKVLENYPNPESIPENNVKLAREKGIEYFRNLLSKCVK